MAKISTSTKVENKLTSQIYIAVDHLKNGNYQLNVTEKNTVVSSLKFTK